MRRTSRFRRLKSPCTRRASSSGPANCDTHGQTKPWVRSGKSAGMRRRRFADARHKSTKRGIGLAPSSSATVTAGPGASHPGRGPPDRRQSFARGAGRLRHRVPIAAASQFLEANAIDEAHQGKGRKIFEPARLRMDHFRHRHRSGNHPHQVNFLLAQRRIVLINTEHDRLARGVQMELEIRIAQAAGKRLNSGHGAARKRRVNDSFQDRRGQTAARLRTDPSGFAGGAGNHTDHHRRSASEYRCSSVARHRKRRSSTASPSCRYQRVSTLRCRPSVRTVTRPFWSVRRISAWCSVSLSSTSRLGWP